MVVYIWEETPCRNPNSQHGLDQLEQTWPDRGLTGPLAFGFLHLWWSSRPTHGTLTRCCTSHSNICLFEGYRQGAAHFILGLAHRTWTDRWPSQSRTCEHAEPVSSTCSFHPLAARVNGIHVASSSGVIYLPSGYENCPRQAQWPSLSA